MNLPFADSFDYSQSLSLYIHVPFCISKCSYCAFYSVPGCKEKDFDGFTERLLKEISVINTKMGNRPYETAFIGGGNPGCLGAWRLERIASAVCANGRPSEFSVEMNPESLDESFFPLFGNRFTRLSMGVQSLDPEALRFLGRNADLQSTKKGLELSQELHEETGCTLSYDLITCLGNGHDEMSDVRALCDNYPSDHISVYALTLEEGTPLWKKNPVLPDADGQYVILSSVWKELESRGFEHYEVSNFAKPGHRCLHNCRYWAYGQYAGLGPGAASTAFSPDGKVRRFSFRPSVKDYAAGELFSGCDCETLSRTEAAEELVFMGLRYKGGLDVSRFEAMSGKPIDSRLVRSLDGFALRDGFLVPDDSGLMKADGAASAIIREL